MDCLLHTGPEALDRLRALGFEPEDIYQPLGEAAAEARLCTDMDSPGMPGYVFWSRTNRFLRERKVREGWRYSNAQTILRCIHPSGDFAVTAMSGYGRVGDKAARYLGDVRTKNPKGAAIAQLVGNNELVLFPLPGRPDNEADVNDIVTWFLLYKSDSNGLSFELSLPREMHGKYVDTWRERIILPENPFIGPEFDIKKLDVVSDIVVDAGAEVDVPVGYKGAI